MAWDCLTEPKMCASRTSTRLPSPVLPFNGDIQDRVFLHQSGLEEAGSYIALSYCWGSTTQVKLNANNLESFASRGIEINYSPRLVIFDSGPPQWHCKEKWQIFGLNIDPSHLLSNLPYASRLEITTEDCCTVAEASFKHVDLEEPPEDHIGMWLTWLPLLEQYSQKALIYHSDKLLALSALASERHQSRTTGTYLAGLWSG